MSESSLSALYLQNPQLAIALRRRLEAEQQIQQGSSGEQIRSPWQGVNRLAQAARIPVTVLVGQAPAGLNATGAADLETWYQECEAWRETTLTPALRQVLRVLLAEIRAGELSAQAWPLVVETL